MMKWKNNKGIGLIELLVVIAVVAMTTPLLFWMFTYGLQSYSSYNKYIEQQYKVMDVTQRIRKDIEESAAYKIAYDTSVNPIPLNILTLWVPDDDSDVSTFSIRIWKIEAGKLYLKTGAGTVSDGLDAMADGSGYTEILGGLDTSTDTDHLGNYFLPTRFEFVKDRILLSIKPVKENTVVSKNRNVIKPVVTEFSIRYKENIA